MRRWARLIPKLIQHQSHTLLQVSAARPAPAQNLCIRGYASTTEHLPLPRHGRPYAVFNRVERPTGEAASKASAWVQLLEPALPGHLRREIQPLPTDGTTTDALTTTSSLTLNAADVAEIIIAARNHQDVNGPIDVLYDISVTQGRWRAAVWMVKIIAEAFAAPHPAMSSRLKWTLWPWRNTASLEELTAQDEGILIERPSHGSLIGKHAIRDVPLLSDVIDTPKPENMSSEEFLRHDVLGCVWRALGSMTLACANDPQLAGGGMKPEVLEIIALLHHHEIMPTSIYNYNPPADGQALQQPPMLHLLSSRILTSLSDAAWRAHEAQVIEEAKSKVGNYNWFRPEIPGTSYRVRVSGVKPEVWLELILWSCLHGGWILDGASILRAMCREVPNDVQNQWLPAAGTWTPMSWRDRLRRSLPVGQEDNVPDLATLKYIFDTHAASTMDLDANVALGLERTISSEVVSAYVTALVNDVQTGVGERGLPPLTVLQHLRVFRNFLVRSELRLTGSSWDAIALRLADSTGIDLHKSPRVAETIAALSPNVAAESYEAPTECLSDFWQGSALPHGLLHRALNAEVLNGNLRGAFKVFKALQDRTDEDKYRSIVQFFESQRAVPIGTGNGFFTARNTSSSAASHPSILHRLPPAILASLMTLTLDAKAYTMAKWFLYNDDIDGPAVPRSMYKDALLAPALVRLAIGTQDKSLLRAIFTIHGTEAPSGGSALPARVLREIMNAHILSQQWDSAGRVLDFIRSTETTEYGWKIENLVALAQVMIRRDPKSVSKAAPSETSAESLFAHMVRTSRGPLKVPTDTITLLLSTLNENWYRFVTSLRPRWMSDKYFHFGLHARAFNSLLEALMDAEGVPAGLRLLEIFWPQGVQDAQQRMVATQGTAGAARVVKRRRQVVDSVQRQRSVVFPPSHDGKRVVMYGGLTPNMATFRLLIGKLVEGLPVGSDKGGETVEISTEDSSVGSRSSAQHLDPEFRSQLEWVAKTWCGFGMSLSGVEDEAFRALEGKKRGHWKDPVGALIRQVKHNRP